MKIITIGREFGSGGRELGKRLADALGIPCYDKEIINEVAKTQGIVPERVERISESDIHLLYPATIGHSFISPFYYEGSDVQILVSQQEVIKKLSHNGDCVIIGRGADVILKDMHPFNIFVYADTQSKLARCLEHADAGETEKEILRQMKRIDRNRASSRKFLTDSRWGDKEAYDLCINTSNMSIKDIVPSLADLIRKVR